VIEPLRSLHPGRTAIELNRRSSALQQSIEVVTPVNAEPLSILGFARYPSPDFLAPAPARLHPIRRSIPCENDHSRTGSALILMLGARCLAAGSHRGVLRVGHQGQRRPAEFGGTASTRVDRVDDLALFVGRTEREQSARGSGTGGEHLEHRLVDGVVQGHRQRERPSRCSATRRARRTRSRPS